MTALRVERWTYLVRAFPSGLLGSSEKFDTPELAEAAAYTHASQVGVSVKSVELLRGR